jgi:hypothetical protein
MGDSWDHPESYELCSWQLRGAEGDWLEERKAGWRQVWDKGWRYVGDTAEACCLTISQKFVSKQMCGYLPWTKCGPLKKKLSWGHLGFSVTGLPGGAIQPHQKESRNTQVLWKESSKASLNKTIYAWDKWINCIRGARVSGPLRTSSEYLKTGKIYSDHIPETPRNTSLNNLQSPENMANVPWPHHSSSITTSTLTWHRKQSSWIGAGEREETHLFPRADFLQEVILAWGRDTKQLTSSLTACTWYCLIIELRW